MNVAKLPIEKAFEPDEEARQPLDESIMSPPFEQNPPIQSLSENTETTENSSSYKSSQPAPGLSHLERLLWLQKRRAAGLWAQCDECNRWRYLPNVLDSYELPKKWYCRMNPDPSVASCSIPESPIRIHEEEDLIHSKYSAGSVVWARVPGWPWWPAMVDDCPDTEQFYWLDGFSDIPTHYNVVFFDSMETTRAWIAPEQLKPYGSSRNLLKHLLKNKRYKKRLEVAAKQADDALSMSLGKRLEKYSFIARYKGNIVKPKKINKIALQKYQKTFMRKFNIELTMADTSESDEDSDVDAQTIPAKRNNVIVLGTPKKTKAAMSRVLKNFDGEDGIDRKGSIAHIVQNGNQNTDVSVNNVFKNPNSMTVQVGNTLDCATSEYFDNDTSKTYVPENGTEETMTESQDFHIRISTPGSDDFDF